MKLKNKMRNLLLLALLLFSRSFTQEIPIKAMVLTEALGLFNGIINVKYEKIVNPKNSWKIGGFIWNYDTQNWKWNATGGEFLYKTFTKPENSPAGIWWGFGAQVMNMQVEHTYTDYEIDSNWNIIEVQKTSNGNFTLYGPVACLGYNWLLGANKGFVISAFGGVSHIMGTAELDGEKLPYGGTSFGVGVEVGITLK